MSAGCGSDMADKVAGQPCTRTDQCATGLHCSGGSCVALLKPDAGADDDGGRKDDNGK
jgi:hypothetical protein